MTRHSKADWDAAAPILEEALLRGGDTTPLDVIWEHVQHGRMDFWSWPGAVFVTEVIDNNATKEREVLILLGGGNLTSLEQHLPIVEQWAKKIGADYMSITGRRGWERSFLTRSAGYDAIATVFTKELNDG